MIILAYHDIDSPGCINEKHGSDAYHYVLDRDVFARHLDAIAGSGLKVLTSRDLADYDRQAKALPDNGIGLTFDDGHRSFFEVVRPMLKERGFMADCFQIVGDIGASHSMSAAQLRMLHAEGFAIGAHGMSHRPLSRLSRHELREELLQSRTRLEDALGAPVTAMAYPHGARTHRTDCEARAAGFDWIYTSEPGELLNVKSGHTLPRIAITRHTDLATFMRLIEGEPLLMARLVLRRRLLTWSRRILGERLYQGVRTRLIGHDPD
jgi:peptidoglycan/xylan/chitin deacetylase (PgdA/CDA1 family)